MDIDSLFDLSGKVAVITGGGVQTLDQTLHAPQVNACIIL